MEYIKHIEFVKTFDASPAILINEGECYDEDELNEIINDIMGWDGETCSNGPENNNFSKRDHEIWSMLLNIRDYYILREEFID